MGNAESLHVYQLPAENTKVSIKDTYLVYCGFVNVEFGQ